MALDATHSSEVTVCGLVIRSGSGTWPDGYQPQDQQDEAKTQTRKIQTETEPSAPKTGQFEFVLMGSDGGLNKGGISQIRAHTTREMHKARRISGQTFPRRRHDMSGNIFFGSEIDAFRALPQLPVETYKPKVFDEIKRNVFHVFNQKLMNESVWPHGARDDAFFAGMMLMCSVHLDSMSSDKSSAVTTAIKLEAMKLVRGRMGSSSGDMLIGCISAIACLASTALVRGGAEGAEEYLIHRKAYAVLINDVFRQQKFETSRFYKDVLKVITMILYACRPISFVSGLTSRRGLFEHQHLHRVGSAEDAACLSPG
ncbi:hypothetical protein, variant 1 [Exophiala sideris]|uniref:Uncharacterized protein n=1 Tax=Exophiala sideris TaxID=1016849 RepID=A0A0D1XDY6_9EURO|nr:hypothetical protein, variant 1 [Exophiala sideris]